MRRLLPFVVLFVFSCNVSLAGTQPLAEQKRNEANSKLDAVNSSYWSAESWYYSWAVLVEIGQLPDSEYVHTEFAKAGLEREQAFDNFMSCVAKYNVGDWSQCVIYATVSIEQSGDSIRHSANVIEECIARMGGQ